MSSRNSKIILFGIVVAFFAMFFAFCIEQIIETGHEQDACHAKGGIAAVSRDDGYSGTLCVKKDGFIK